MNVFKGRHFGGEIVLWTVRWHCRYPISYRDLEAMMTGRDVAVDHSTIYRWVHLPHELAHGIEQGFTHEAHRPNSTDTTSTHLDRCDCLTRERLGRKHRGRKAVEAEGIPAPGGQSGSHS